MKFLRENKMRIHPKLASGLFAIIYSITVLLIDKIFHINFLYSKFFLIIMLIGGIVVYFYFWKKYDE